MDNFAKVQSDSRPTTSNSRRARPISNTGSPQHRAAGRSTPVKETNLVSVKRVEQSNSSFSPDLLSEKFSDMMSAENDMAAAELEAYTSLDAPDNMTGARKSASMTRIESKTDGRSSQNGHAKPGTEHHGGDKTDLNEESSEDDDDGERKAPNELIMEFLDCVMEKDIENAIKLCKMILIYEPNHKDALQFQSLLQLKKEQDEEEASGEEDSDDESDSDDDESDDSDEDDSDEESSEEEEVQETAAGATAQKSLSPRSLKGNQKWKPTNR